MSITNRSDIRNSGAYTQNTPLLSRIVCNILRQFGARSNETHFSSQDVPQLRKLIELELSENRSQTRHSSISGRGDTRSFLIGPGYHRSKFCNSEHFSTATDTVLPI